MSSPSSSRSRKKFNFKRPQNPFREPSGQHRSRSTSLSKSKKRSIEVMEDEGIRPSTSSGNRRGRSQKGSPSKIKRSSRNNVSEATVVGRTSVSPGRSDSKRLRGEKGKSLKQTLRDTVLDEGADLRQSLRQLEDKNVRLKQKLDSRDFQLQKSQDKVKALETKTKKEHESHIKEKSDMEKEIIKLRKRCEKSELELSKVESLRTANNTNGGEAFFQDVLGNLQDFLDNQLQCTICSEVYLLATVTNCGHTFCDDCIEVWKTKQRNATCPICRTEIIMSSPNQALDGCIEKFIDNFYPEAAKTARAQILSERTEKKEARIAKQKQQEEQNTLLGGLLSAETRRGLARRIEDTSDDDSSWDIPRLGRSPARLSMSDLDLEINSRSSSVASTRSTGRNTPDPDMARDYPGLSGLPGLSSFSFWSDDSESDVSFDPNLNNTRESIENETSDAISEISTASNNSDASDTPDDNSDVNEENNSTDDFDEDDHGATFSDDDSD